MTKKYVFLDIDGTLVDYSGRMPESAKRALSAARENGHRLILCTGRFYSQIYGWLLGIIPFDGFVTSSGAHVRLDGRTVFTHYFPGDMIRELRRVCGPLGAALMFHTDGHLVTTREELDAARDFFGRSGAGKDACDALFGQVEFARAEEMDCIEKAVYYGAKPFAEMRKLFSGFALDPYSYKHLPDTCGEVMPAGVTKALGISKLLEHAGADRDDSIGIGDGGNDLEMIKYCGTGVAMGNASDALKQAADFVTTPIGEGGIANAFRRLGLID